jgi:Transposase IS66 family
MAIVSISPGKASGRAAWHISSARPKAWQRVWKWAWLAVAGGVHAELQRLCPMGTERPTVGQWRAWYARFKQLLNQYAAQEDKAGTLARRLEREGESLWVFLDVQGVEATNNITERAHRCGGLWHKRSQGTCSEKGSRWVERVLSLRHTCRIRGRPTFPVLIEAVSCLFKGEKLDLSWITQHVFLPVPSTPVIRYVLSGPRLADPDSLYRARLSLCGSPAAGVW